MYYIHVPFCDEKSVRLVIFPKWLLIKSIFQSNPQDSHFGRHKHLTNHHFYLFYSSNPKTVNSSPNDLKYNDYDRNVAHPHRRACPLFFLDGPCCIWILVVITRMMTNNTPGKNALSRPLPPPPQSPSQPPPPPARLPSSWEIIKKGSMHVGRPWGRTETKWREKDF